MITLNERLQFFAQTLNEQPKQFQLEDLEELDATLANLAQATEEEATKKLNIWFRNHESVTDAIDNLAATREINQSLRLPASSEAGILQNMFELRTQVKETIENKKQGEQDKSKISENT